MMDKRETIEVFYVSEEVSLFSTNKNPETKTGVQAKNQKSKAVKLLEVGS